MTPRLFLREGAKADIREAFTWYESRSTGLGFEFLRAVRTTLASIERGPTQYAVVLDDMRRAGLRRFPYAVYYFIDGDALVALACLHGRRDPQRWQSRR